jgi:preprotein translocase subunit SecF
LLKDKLKSATGADVEIRRIEIVGPQVGKDLQRKALLAIFFSLLFITIYISGRFEFKWITSGIISGVLMGGVYLLYLFEVSMVILILAAMILSLILLWLLNLKYGMGAIVTLIHDTMIIVGIFSFMGKEFTLPVIASLLTYIGYSLNDTIVIFDRIRENLKKHPRHSMEAIINRSINETLSRTILTSGTVLIVVASLFFLGGEIIHDFALVMLLGVFIGTYSTIYISCPVLLFWPDSRKK